LVVVALGLAAIIGGVRLVTRTCSDKWRVLIDGLGVAFLCLRCLFPKRFDGWFLAAPYLLLGLLCVVSPFRFIVPYLAP
jgi:hypothetical protein